MVRLLFFLFISLSGLISQVAWASPTACAVQLGIQTSLAQQFRPHVGLFDDVPPWRFAKALLQESIPDVVIPSLTNRLALIENKKVSSYLSLVKRFKGEPELMKQWIGARNRFSRIDGNSEQEVLVHNLRGDILIYNWLNDGKTLTAERLLEAHEASMQESLVLTDEKGRALNVSIGRFRTKEVSAGSGKRIYPKSSDVRVAVKDFLNWFERNEGHMHPLILAANSYRWLVSIQPFADGNKRTARLIADWILVKNGYPVLTAPRDFFSLGGMVYGNLSYKENERPWEFFDSFLTAVEYSVDLVNQLNSVGTLKQVGAQ